MIDVRSRQEQEADTQGQGVSSALFSALEAAARAAGCPRLRTYARLMTEPAFARCGFHVIAHDTSERSGQVLARAVMEKPLT